MQNGVNRMVRVLAVIMAAVLLGSCHMFEDRTTMDDVAVEFDQSNVSVFEGGLGAVTLKVTPQDAIASKDVKWNIGNEEVAVIYQADKRGCVFYGLKAGSTTLTANVKDAQAAMVVTVLKEVSK